jgi:hypothetical protein
VRIRKEMMIRSKRTRMIIAVAGSLVCALAGVTSGLVVTACSAPTPPPPPAPPAQTSTVSSDAGPLQAAVDAWNASV